MISSVFVNEIRNCLYAGAITVLGLEVVLILREGPADFPRGSFVAAVLLFYVLFALLEHGFAFLGEGRGTGRGRRLLWLLPAAVLFLALRGRFVWPYADEAVMAAAALRAGLVFISGREKVFRLGIFALDVAALILFLAMDVLSGAYGTDKALFVCLAVLTLDSLQRMICERGRGAFPFWYFGAMAVILLVLPMGREPIEWTHVISAGQALAGRVMEAADSLSYYFSTVFRAESLETGYSSFDMTGELVHRSERTELVLRTSSLPYSIFTDEESGRSMKVRRTLRLTGGLGVEGEQLVRFLCFLHAHQVDRKEAMLFSQLSHVDVEYAYLDTYDEIAPAGSMIITAEDLKIQTGSGGKRHRKGYSLKAAYLDIDYGSPYFEELMREEGAAGSGPGSGSLGNTDPTNGSGLSGYLDDALASDVFGASEETMSYGEICDYVRELYDLDFHRVMSEREYEETAGRVTGEMEQAAGPAYLDAMEASARMAELALELTAGQADPYDKCMAIEAYLRQYSYSRNAAGGRDPLSDMSSAEGMADIADRFLFETQEGYCVHYTSAMVMLLRLSGIPARAVSGYRYDFPFEKQETYPVSSECAHTWPEAFLSGIGWVPFEPTASVGTASQYSWHRRRTGETGAEAEALPAGIPTPVPAADPETAPEEQDPDAGILTQALAIAGPVVLSVILLIVLLIGGSRLLGWIRYHRSTPAQRLKADVEAILPLLRRHAACPIPDRGLLSDYLQAAPEELRESLGVVFSTYYRVIYGNEATPSCDVQVSEQAKAIREALRRYSFDRTGRDGIRQFIAAHTFHKKAE